MGTPSSVLLRVVMLSAIVSFAFALDADSPRVESLASKLHCDCGCGDILKECSHAKCENRGSLKRELVDAVQQGRTDEQILELMSIRHGAAILLTPTFRGFDTLLWIVPITLSLLTFALVLFQRLRSRRP